MPRLDCAMDAALLLAALAARAGDRVDLIAFDRRIRARVGGTARAQVLPAIVAAMAPLEAELIESDWAGDGQLDPCPRPAAVPGGAAHGPQPGSHRGGLLPSLPALTTRHLVVLAAVADPRIAEMAARPR